ncbi:hypothetical protein [Weissella paramesenteroides]|uniref:hypothetical protein n=1 Tax=Weissella paramesenteroides TaxID=1249 RepID=UPI003F748944
MNFKTISSFVYSSLTMIFLVPGTLGRILTVFHIPFGNIISNFTMLMLFFMTIFLIIIDSKKTINIFFSFMSFLFILILYEISSISGQPISWRLSGYIFLLILLALLIFDRKNSLVSSMGIFLGVIVFGLINSVIGLTQYFSQSVILPDVSTLHESTIRLNSDMWFLGSTGTLRAFGFLSSGMSFGTIMVLALSVIWYEKIKLPKLMKYIFLVLFLAGIITSLTKNVYVLGLLTILLKYVPRIIKKFVFWGGVVIQFLGGLLAVLIQNSPYFQSDFFATFKIRFTGLIYFKDYYANDLRSVLFGHGFQYDASYKNFTNLALDNQLWALFFEGGVLLIVLVYFLIYVVAFDKKIEHYCFTNVLVLFGIFGISNNYLMFFLGTAVLAKLVNVSDYGDLSKSSERIESGKHKFKS